MPDASDDRKSILSDLYRLYKEKGPSSYAAAHTLSCFRPGDPVILTAVKRLIAEKLVLTTSFDDHDKKDALALALNPERLSEVEAIIATQTKEPDRHVVRLMVLVILLVFGLAGFWLFQDKLSVAILWLVFVMAAIPPVWAFFFESGKLKGADVVEIYKVGLGSIPVVGKLFGRSE